MILNPNSPIPLYRQLADLLTSRIQSGEYAPGSRIPSEPRLAAMLRIGRPTVRQALDVLVRKGILSRRRGSGTYVREPRQEVELFSLDGTGASFHKKGVPVETRILSPLACRTAEGPDDNPFKGRPAYFFSRLTLAAGAPVLMEDLYLHIDLFPGLDRQELQGRSLSAVVEELYHLRTQGGKQSFHIGYPDDAKARHLQVTPEMPILVVKRWLHFPQAPEGVFSELWCRTDQFVFSQVIGGMEHA